MTCHGWLEGVHLFTNKVYNNNNVYSEKILQIIRKIKKFYCIPNQNKTSPQQPPPGISSATSVCVEK